MSFPKCVELIVALLLCLGVHVALGDEGRTSSGLELQSDDEVEDPGLRKVETEYYVAVVGKPVKIERLDKERFGNLAPWDIASYTDFDKECMKKCVPEGPVCWKRCAVERVYDAEDENNTDMPAENEGTIVISNSCGFMRTTFEHALLADPKSEPLKFIKQKPFSIYVTIGEWCKLGNYVREEGEGLLLGKWGESFYELVNFTLFKGTTDGYFLSLSEFGKRDLEQIRSLLVPIEEKQQVCFNSDDLRPAEVAEITAHGMFRRRQQTYDLCETHGLPISKVGSVYRKVGYF